MVKIWTLPNSEAATAHSQAFYEDESKQIRCTHAKRIVYCAANARTVLIVSPTVATVCAHARPRDAVGQVYDSSDFAELVCVLAPSTYERWLDGLFVGVDKLALCASDSVTRLYQLPTKYVLHV
jgi:hypothetical protein